MHVIYLHPHFTSAGGAGRMVLETGSRLAERGHVVHCICIRADEAIVEPYRESITFHEIGGPLSSSLSYWMTYRGRENRVVDLARSIACGRFETVLFPQVFPSNWWGTAVLRKVPDLPCIWYCHEPSAFIHSDRWISALPWPKNKIAKTLRPVLKSIDLRRMQVYTQVFANSDHSRRSIVETYGYASDRCETLYLGVDHERFKTNDSVQRERTICTVAKLTPFKNVDRLIRALCVLRQKGDRQVRLQIIGEGDAKPDLQRLAAELNVSDQVEFLGFVEDDQLVEKLQRAMVFCIVSDDEPFGLVTLEALACGTPVVAMDSGGPREILMGYSCGMLVSQASPIALAEALKLFLNSDRYRQDSLAAQQRAAQFNWNATADELEKRMLSAIAKRKRPFAATTGGTASSPVK